MLCLIRVEGRPDEKRELREGRKRRGTGCRYPARLKSAGHWSNAEGNRGRVGLREVIGESEEVEPEILISFAQPFRLPQTRHACQRHNDRTTPAGVPVSSSSSHTHAECLSRADLVLFLGSNQHGPFQAMSLLWAKQNTELPLSPLRCTAR